MPTPSNEIMPRERTESLSVSNPIDSLPHYDKIKCRPARQSNQSKVLSGGSANASHGVSKVVEDKPKMSVIHLTCAVWRQDGEVSDQFLTSQCQGAKEQMDGYLNPERRGTATRTRRGSKGWDGISRGRGPGVFAFTADPSQSGPPPDKYV